MSAASTKAPANTSSSALNWVDGEWVDTADHGESIDPATSAVIGSYAIAGAPEAARAIAAAKRAFEDEVWRTDKTLRARVLNDMADRFKARAEEFVHLLGLENGKVHAHGRVEVSFVPQTLRFNAALALTEAGRASQVVPGHLGLAIRQPAGVAGIIAPWNSPVALSIRSLAPALAAGTTCVMSLPEQTAQTNALIAQVIADTPGLPRGAVNVLTGGRVTGDALVRSPDVPLISFTGSTRTGKAISATASENLKRLGLELGGKTPLIVFEDADLPSTLPLVVAALTVFSGQFCMTGSRLLVHSSIAAQVRDELVPMFDRLTVRPAADPASQMGPMIDKANVARVNAMVDDAIAAGARVLLRGGPVTEGVLARGAF